MAITHETKESTGEAHLRCGVCLFVLDEGAEQTDMDYDDNLQFVLRTRNFHEFTLEEMIASAKRGCKMCAGLLSAFKCLGIKFITATWAWSRHSPSTGGLLRLDDDNSDKPWCAYELFSPSEDSLKKGMPFWHPVVLERRELPGYTGGDIAMSRAEEWLEECRLSHGKCKASGEVFAPKRLIFVGGEDPDVVELIERPPTVVPYAALSHRWTQGTPLVSSTRSNLERRKQVGMRISALPLMMQQVVATLRRLKILYVWIDCLCIVQDDKEDWRREAATMASIYTNAELTVAATGCSEIDEGLFRDRTGLQPKIAEINGHSIFLRRELQHFRWGNLQSSLFRRTPNICQGAQSALLLRGWVYQEQLLSRRVLHFARNELFWECYEASICECGGSQRHDEVQSDHVRDKEPVADRPWRIIITEYAGRPMTYESDRLPAIAGIAKSMLKSKSAKDKTDPASYVCGMWMDDRELRQTFFWHLRMYPPTRGRPESKIPTWSWASTFGSVAFLSSKNYSDTVLTEFHENIEFLHTKAKFIDGVDSMLGYVESASITLSGRILPGVVRHGQDLVTLVQSSARRYPEAWQSSDDWKTRFVLEVEGRLAGFNADYQLNVPGEHFIESGTPVSCLLIGEIAFKPHGRTEGKPVPACLVLRCVDEKEQLYERLGLFRGHHWHRDHWIDTETFVRLSTKRQVTVI